MFKTNILPEEEIENHGDNLYKDRLEKKQE